MIAAGGDAAMVDRIVPLVPTRESWVQAALADLPTLLIDHAHCEKKAAATAVRFLFKYPDWSRLCAAMSKLAREELLHFDRVLGELRAQKVSFRGLPAAGYAQALFSWARDHEPRGRVDEMLICALIEARSHERFVRLAAALDEGGPTDLRLAAFYRELGVAEARHGSLYLDLAAEAAEAAGDESRPASRLAELAQAEAAIVARPLQPLRMHAGG